jgi:transglutaminase-like putative cysteine protease
MFAPLAHLHYRRTLLAATLLSPLVLCQPAIADDPKLQSLIDAGAYTEAEKLLAEQISDPDAPATSPAAIQLEILRRTRHDFSLTPQDVLRQIKESVPDASPADVERWREAGDLQARTIDGQTRYFRQAVSNFFRFNQEARQRRASDKEDENKFDLTAHARELVRLSEAAAGAEVYPVKHRIVYELAVNKGHPRAKPGAVVRAWLPFAQEYRQQRDARMLRSDPAGAVIAENGSPHRTVYFEQTIDDAAAPPRFHVEFEFTTSAYCPKLDPERVQPYNLSGDEYRQYTAERPPHIVFTPEVKRLAVEIVGDEQNPLEKARRIFRWVSQNIPWCSEMEYSIIPNISAKGLSARRGDCGVKGMTFITLCRAAGVPARWQSGWQLRPGDWNMHDWAEFYVEPWGWLPADPSYGLQKSDRAEVREFYFGHQDSYRLIVNLDYGSPLIPAKQSLRSEPADFQRGEVELDGRNLYFNEWDYNINFQWDPR